MRSLNIAMLSIHSSPVGPVGTENTGGMSVYVRETARWLGQNGHHVDIYTCAGHGTEIVTLYPNVRLICAGRGLFSGIPKDQLPDHLPALFDAVETFRRDHGLTYDIIHSHYWISGVVGAMAQAQWNCPHLLMFHTLGAAKNRTQTSENESVLRLGHEQWLVVAADHIVVPTQQEREHIISLYHAHPSKISVIPCGVDPKLFHPVDRQGARRSLGVAPDTDLVLYVGRFAPLKGVDTIIEAAAQLHARHPRLQWFIVGGDDPQSANTRTLTDLVRRHQLENVVHFKGRIEQDQLPVFYNAADMVTLPSHYESFGLVVLEALACGTPVVATAVGAAADVVRTGYNGAIIQAPQAPDLAQGVAQILSVPRHQRPSPGQIRASVESYDWQSVTSAVAQLQTSLIQSHLPDRPKAVYTPGGLLSN